MHARALVAAQAASPLADPSAPSAAERPPAGGYRKVEGDPLGAPNLLRLKPEARIAIALYGPRGAVDVLRANHASERMALREVLEALPEGKEKKIALDRLYDFPQKGSEAKPAPRARKAPKTPDEPRVELRTVDERVEALERLELAAEGAHFRGGWHVYAIDCSSVKGSSSHALYAGPSYARCMEAAEKLTAMTVERGYPFRGGTITRPAMAYDVERLLARLEAGERDGIAADASVRIDVVGGMPVDLPESIAERGEEPGELEGGAVALELVDVMDDEIAKRGIRADTGTERGA